MVKQNVVGVRCFPFMTGFFGGYRSDPDFLADPDPGKKSDPDLGKRTRIRNTGLIHEELCELMP